VAEAKKFAPTLRVLSVTGASRTTKLSQLTEADLVITSYGLLRRDLDFYQQVRFDTVVLDEAQHIKNRQTQNAQAVKAVPADHRLVLTGTPLENSVLDLWSIYDFLMPGYLGSAQDFKERYEVPISKHRDSTAQGRLARRIKPFLLRRTKAQVAPELPPKIEQVSFCEMTAAQAELYHQLLQATRSQVLQLTGEENQGKSRMLVFQALLRLRQVCCDPRLLGVAEGEQENSDTAAAPRSAKPGSGKVELFSELLQEVVDGGHRVLVFSQFVTMLKLLEEQLKQEEIAYCYLDGSTTDRGKVVGKFQSDSNIPVFLISLKAGGVGLNLSGADTVIHFDPWWNPAVEAQATDRAHRMGQTRVVTSYKLITRGTVEEKILELQKRKRALTAGIVEGEEQFAQSLSWEEIQELLA
jgi:SNF2 family DNA or RNA helicase